MRDDLLMKKLENGEPDTSLLKDSKVERDKRVSGFEGTTKETRETKRVLRDEVYPRVERVPDRLRPVLFLTHVEP